jgi:RNase P/RNase MRP subunit p30
MTFVIVDTVPGHFDRKKVIIVSSNSDKRIRECVSSRNVDILLDPHRRRGRQKIHQQDSGLNQVLCSLAHKNHVAIGFSMETMLEDARLRPKIFAQIMQNIRLCKKYKVQIVIFPNEGGNSQDLRSLFRVLGAKNAQLIMEFTPKRIYFKQAYIREGVIKVL